MGQLCVVVPIVALLVAACWGFEDQIVELLDDSMDTSQQVGVGNTVGMHEEAAFHEFIDRHRKQYTKEEYPRRFEIFRDNLNFIRNWNSEDHGFHVGINEMADLTDQEFATVYLDPHVEEAYLSSATYRNSAAYKAQNAASRSLLQFEDESEGGKYDVRWHKNTGAQPQEQDWTKKSVLTGINNQAKCFACYAFSACGAIEAAVHINGGKLVKLSAQQIVDCSDKYRNHRCKGGTMVKSYKYIADNGLMRDEDYGYNTILNSSPQCKHTSSQCKYDTTQTVQSVVGYVNVVQGSEDDIMNAASTRPVSAAIDAHHRPFKLYSSGVFSLASCTSHLTHGLLIVGYGTEQDGRKYWKVKNSWGTSWGDQGYGKVSRGDNMCSIADWVNYPIVDAADGRKVSAVRSLEELGDQQDIESSSDQPEQHDHPEVNGGFETPWNAIRLQESQPSNSRR